MELTHDEAHAVLDTWVQDLDRQHKRKMTILLTQEFIDLGMAKVAAYKRSAKVFHLSGSAVRKQ